MTKEELANRIKERRLHLQRGNPRYTQQYVADKLGIGREAYAHYEQGRNDVRALDLVKLADIFDVEVAYFYEEYDAGMIDDADVMMYYRGMAPPLKPAAKAALKAMFEQQDREDAVTTVGKKAE